eukprot:1161966-Pelagomonas_calceolata.AAC.2
MQTRAWRYSRGCCWISLASGHGVSHSCASEYRPCYTHPASIVLRALEGRKEGRGYIAVPAHEGSSAEAKKVPVFKLFQPGEQVFSRH